MKVNCTWSGPNTTVSNRKYCTKRTCQNHFKLFFFHSDGQDIESQQRWYYDSSDGTCKEFDYLGKKGNGNRFLTRQDCQASCQPSQVEREKANYLYYLQKEF